MEFCAYSERVSTIDDNRVVARGSTTSGEVAACVPEELGDEGTPLEERSGE